MSKTTYFAEKHIFDTRSDKNIIEIKSGDGKTLTIDGATLTNATITDADITGSVSAGGSTTQLQYNNAGTLSGISTITYANGALNSTVPIKLDSTGYISFKGSINPDYYIDDQDTTWIDIESEPHARSSGTNAPSYAAWNGGNLYAYEFPGSGALKELFYSIHVPHMYNAVDNLGVYFHAHVVTNATVFTGTCKINFEYTYAGPNGEAFPATQTISATTTFTTQYQHRIVEIPSPVLAGQLEVDGVIDVRCYRDPGDVADTFTGSVFVLFLDSHINVNKIGTKFRNKATGSFYI